MSTGKGTTLDRLDEYVSGTLDDSDAATFEEEMFAAVGGDTAVEADLRFFDRVNRMLTVLVAQGVLAGPSTERDIERLRTAGLNVHVVDFPAGNNAVEIEPWASDVQVVVFRCHVDVRAYDDVEVEVENADGTPVKTFRGVECDPATGNIFGVCAEPLARMAYATRRRISRITGVRHGKREVVSVVDSRPRD